MANAPETSVVGDGDLVRTGERVGVCIFVGNVGYGLF